MACDRHRDRPDRCPGVLRLHAAPDGHLARVRVPGGRVSRAQLQTLASAAALSDGALELTSRSNLQLRGLAADAGPALAALLSRAGLFPSAAHDRVRNVLASPLAGRHPGSLADTDPLVRQLDRRLCSDPELAELPGRFLFAVDDGSGLMLGQGADVTLAASTPESFSLALAGRPAALGLDADEAARLGVDAARAFLHERAAAGSMAWRIAELEEGASGVARRLGLELSGRADAHAGGALEPGWLGQRDGRLALTVRAPGGRLERDAVASLPALMREHGVLELRLSPWRTLTAADLDRPTAEALAPELEGLGLLIAEGAVA
jgi:precorrin-3B synthase